MMLGTPTTQDRSGWWAGGRTAACNGVNSLLLLSLLDDEGDELLDQQDEDEEPDDPTHDAQDNEGHGVVHFFHCMARAGREGGGRGEQESTGAQQDGSPMATALQPAPTQPPALPKPCSRKRKMEHGAYQAKAQHKEVPPPPPPHTYPPTDTHTQFWNNSDSGPTAGLTWPPNTHIKNVTASFWVFFVHTGKIKTLLVTTFMWQVDFGVRASGF